MKAPKCLRERAQWLNWKLVNGNKIPVTKTGAPGKSNDPATWSTYQSAVRVKSKFSGIAFVFSEEDPFCGVDLDNCLDEDQNLLDWAKPFFEKLSGCAYCEVSPSGRGVKFVVQAKKLEGSRCVHVVNKDLKQQCEVYDSKRFWVITEEPYRPDEFPELSCTQNLNTRQSSQKGQAAVDWICTEFLLSSADRCLAPSAQPVPALSRVVTSDEMALDARMEAYVQQVDAEAPGNRNNSIFRLSGNLKAFPGATDEMVEQHCRAYNQSLIEPLEEDEFLKAVRSGLKNGTPRQVKEDREPEIPAIPAEVDFSNFMTGSSPAPKSKLLRRGLIYEAPGMLGEIVRWIDATCLYQLPELFLASALAVMSLLTGRKICDRFNGRTNLFILAMGLTGSGKDHGRKCAKRLFEACGHPELIAPEDMGSAAGMIARLEQHPATLFQIDEFGHFLEQILSDKAQPYLKTLESELLKIYTSSNTVYMGRALADVEKTPRIDQPHCVILGSCTPSTLWESISMGSVHAGFLNRLHIFESPEYAPLKENLPLGVDKLEPPAELVEKAKFWIDYEPSGGNLAGSYPRPREMGWTPEVEKRLTDHMRRISNKRIGEDSVHAAIWSRSSEKANKLAMLAAASRQSFEVNMDDAEWAIEVQNHLTRKLIQKIEKNVSDSPWERLKKKALSKIDRKIELTAFTRKTQYLREKERKDIIRELSEAGLIVCTTVPGKTKPTMWLEPAS